MKLKYYLRGVGVGLILAVVIYSTIVIPHKTEMTDDEIMARARALGMVEKEETDVDLSALTGTPSPSPDEPPLEGEGTPTPTLPAEGDLTPTAAVLPGGEEAPEPPEKPSAPSGIPGITMPPQPTSDAVTIPPQTPSIAPPEDGGVAGGEKVSILVTSGMGSEAFAIAAEKAGLIEDAADFERYLMQNGYADSLKVGTFMIPLGAGYEEIAGIVTGK